MVITKIVTMILLPLAAQTSDNEWPQWRGPTHAGKAVDISFSPQKGTALNTVWKKELGSGYSSVSIANDLAITMFSDGEYDFMIAFDAHSGEERWRYQIDTTYHGSIDGPLSTPVIDNDSAYGLGPKGQLFACQLITGKEIWMIDLKQRNAKQPRFGWSTSPLVVEDLLICQTGKEKSGISAFNKHTGEIVWSTGDFMVNYQSPFLATLGGQKQIISVSDNFIIGHEPKTGKEIWKFKHEGDWAVIEPIMVGENRMFINYKYDEAILIEIDVENNYHVSTIWKNKHIKNTENPSVYHDGLIYGYSGAILTCVDAQTGDRKWRSRAPGEGFLMMVNDKLVTLTKKGTLHVAEVDEEGYKERSQIKLLEGMGHNPPSFAYGKIFARNYQEIAAVGLGSEINQMVSKKRVFGQIPESQFGLFITELTKSQNKAEMIDTFMKQQTQFPIIEGRYVHVVYRGEVEDLAISGDMIAFREHHPFNKVEGTDLHYYSFELVPDAHITYGLVKNYEENMTDPLNPLKVPKYEGELSAIAMPHWKKNSHLDPPQGPRGELEEFEFESKILKNKRNISVYKPANFDKSKTYPVLYFYDATEALQYGNIDRSLDNLIGHKIDPIIVVFIELRSWIEIAGETMEDFGNMIVSELVPHIDQLYPTVNNASGRAVLGQDSAGFNAIHTALKFPDTFHWAGGQSTSVEGRDGKKLKERISASTNHTTRFYMDWGLYDRRTSTTNRAKASREIFQEFKKNGFKIVGGEQPTGYGWGNWRTLTDQYLKTFFPLTDKTTTN